MPETTADLVTLIRSGDFSRLRDELSRMRPQELAGAFCDLRGDDQVLAFRILPRRSTAAVFEYMPAECQQSLVKAMGQSTTCASTDRTAKR